MQVPFLKWPGGKRWFVEKHGDLFPKKYNTYFEPFLGAGAVFFYLKPSQSVLSDINLDLITAYKGIQQDPSYIKRSLGQHNYHHSADHYYSVRSNRPNCDLKAASRMIYLNRTCFNGIYRVNKNGIFNVPIGSKSKVTLETDDFESISTLLKSSKIILSDFEPIINLAQKDDFIFADPPYTILHNNNGFIKYNEILFTWDDQIRLSNALIRAKKRGCKIILTNANHESIEILYRNSGFDMQTTSRYSSVSGNAKSRNQYEELIIHSV